jgi:hypothetical protein
MDERNVKVTFTNGVLTIKGEKEEEPRCSSGTSFQFVSCCVVVLRQLFESEQRACFSSFRLFFPKTR